MNFDWEIYRNENSLSVSFFRLVVLLWAGSLACLTIFTHLAQTFGLVFRQYAFISLFVFLIIVVIFVWRSKDFWRESKVRDAYVLLGVIAISLFGALVSLSMRRIGRFIPDEYYYGTNPAFYVQHPDSKMGFELLFFYSGGMPFYSVSYLTANAFDYILGAISHLSHFQFAKVYYELGGGLGGFIIPLSIYLALTQFTSDTKPAALGAFFVTFGIFLLAETVWTPGGYSFLRSFEGKVIMLFAGVPLFAYFSLRYFSRPRLSTWISLAAVITMLTGMSTSAFMIFPILGAVLFVSYWSAFREQFKSVIVFLQRGLVYLSSFSYLFGFAFFVAQRDRLETAQAINISNGYTDTIREYLAGYLNPALPLTPIFLLVFSAAALLLAKGRQRTFLSVWMAVVLLTVPNPIVAQFLLKFFRGIYFRLMYVYPFPLVVGIAAGLLYERSLQWKYHKTAWALASLGFALLTFFSPSSLFGSDRYTWGNWSTYKENAAALEIISVAPHGLMIAPYPISGAVRMLDTDYEQLITRDDHMDVYLNKQGRGAEAQLRMKVSDFLDDGKLEDYPFFVRLLETYPQVNSVVFYRKIFYRTEYAETARVLAKYMQSAGFLHRKDLEGSVVFWK